MHTGYEIDPIPQVTIGSTILEPGTDFTLSYENNTNVGTGTVTIKGKGNYTGTKNATFMIGAATLSNAVVSGISNKTYTGKALTQEPIVRVGTTTLTLNSDYTIAYQNNINTGTATVTITGIGNYIGSKVVAFEINKA